MAGGAKGIWKTGPLHFKGESSVVLFVLVLRIVCLRKSGRFHEHRYQPEPCARGVRYSVGRAVFTHRQQSPRVSAARLVWTHRNTYLKWDDRCSNPVLIGRLSFVPAATQAARPWDLKRVVPSVIRLQTWYRKEKRRWPHARYYGSCHTSITGCVHWK
jgi:hypothetical protein